MQRLGRRLPRQVPERDVDRADDPQCLAAREPEHGLIEPLPGEGVFPKEERLVALDQQRGIPAGRRQGGAQECVSLKTLVSADPQQPHLGVAALAARDVAGIARGGNVRPRPERHADVGDAHGLSLRR